MGIQNGEVPFVTYVSDPFQICKSRLEDIPFTLCVATPTWFGASILASFYRANMRSSFAICNLQPSICLFPQEVT